MESSRTSTPVPVPEGSHGDYVIVPEYFRESRDDPGSLRTSTVSNNMQVDWLVDFEEIKLGKVLGEGAQGVVYSATFRHQPVAVKKLNSKLKESQIEELKREAELMRKLKPHCTLFHHSLLTVFVLISLYHSLHSFTHSLCSFSLVLLFQYYYVIVYSFHVI